MTLTTLEPVAVAHLDFPPGCEGRFCTDPARPAQLVIYTRCGCARLACIPCRDQSKRILDNSPTMRRCCPHCHRNLTGGWTDYVKREVPL